MPTTPLSNDFDRETLVGKLRFILGLIWLALVLSGGWAMAATDANTNAPPTSAKPVILFIPKGADVAYWDQISAGARDAARALDVQLHIQAPHDDGDLEGQRRILRNALQLAPDMVILAPVSASQLLPEVAALRKQGIPLLIIDSPLNDPQVVTTLATNNFEAGRVAAEILASQLNNQGTVLLTRMPKTNTATLSREQGFEAGLKQYPQIQLVQTPYFEPYDVGTVRTKMLKLLRAQPPIDAFFAVNESTTTGTLLALRSFKTWRPKVFIGFDASPLLQQAVAQGQISALVAQSPYEMGYQSLELATQALRGDKLPAKIDLEFGIIMPEARVPEDGQLTFGELQVPVWNASQSPSQH